MKKRVFLLLFLLMFLTNIGVVNAASKNIEVTNFKVKEKSGTVSVEAINFSNNTLSSNITFNKKDDFVLLEFKVKNNESDKYRIKNIKDNNTNNNISIEYSFDTDFMPKGEFKVVTMKVTYAKQLKNVDKVSLNNLIITLNLENDKEDVETSNNNTISNNTNLELRKNKTSYDYSSQFLENEDIFDKLDISKDIFKANLFDYYKCKFFLFHFETFQYVQNFSFY